MEVKRISRIYEEIDEIDQLHLKDDIISLNLHGNSLLERILTFLYKLPFFDIVLEGIIPIEKTFQF